MQTTLDYVRNLVNRNSEISKVIIREYPYPPAEPGTPPAQGDRLYSISRSSFLDKKSLSQITDTKPANRILGIESKVYLYKRVKHIPMMDFVIQKSDKELNHLIKIISKELKETCDGGVIIESDKSYQFIGKRLLEPNQFKRLMSWFLVLGKKDENVLVDFQYIGYSLLKGSACLRIEKYPDSDMIPHVVASI